MQNWKELPSWWPSSLRRCPKGDPHLDMCIQCGTCGGSCPSGPDMDYTTRALFEMIRAEMREQVLRSTTPWYCVSCYYCTVRCPQDIHITDIMYTLKRMSIREGHFKASSASDAPAFSKNFIDFVESRGRSFELGLMTRFYVTHHPLNVVKIAPMGLGMVRKGRMDFTPGSIKNTAQLKAILNKAKELEEADYAL